MRLGATIIMTVTLNTLYAQINIWEGTACRKKVEMTAYLVNQNDNQNQNGNMAVIVCPGGSYFWHDMKNEGRYVAEWLQANGISAFILKYRTAGTPAFVLRYRYLFRGNRYPDAHDDLRQALKTVRERAAELGIDPNKVGAMGFSAGGHLVMSCAELLPKEERPAFVASVYPVVTMTEKCVHKRSRRALLGDDKKNDKTLRALLSLEQNVPDDCPPVFLLNCQDDPIVNYHNAELLDSALSLKNIPHSYIQYKTGGHGFGASASKGTEECRSWKDEFLKWVRHENQNENEKQNECSMLNVKPLNTNR
ncbi:MAG: alpha/beta hydrolase [Bacteroidaceae bacterium]|nr:alpha/beta hydrolase [Bacteroidaceae bacterium]